MKPREFHYAEIKDDIRLDFRWKTLKGKVTFFAINVSLLEDDKKYDVYRIDTSHGYLHEQRFWRSPEPKKLEMDFDIAFNKKKREVLENFERWVELFKKRR